MFASLGDVIDAFEAWIRGLRRGRGAPGPRGERGRPRRAPRSCRGLPTGRAAWPSRLVVETGMGLAAERARLEHTFVSALGAATGLVARPVAGAGEGTRLEILGLTGDRPVEARVRASRAPQRRERAGRRRRGARRRGARPGDRRGPGVVRGRRPALRAEGRDRGSGRHRRLRAPSDRDRGHLGGGRHPLSRSPRVGRLRAAYLPPDGGAARALRRGPRAGRPGRDRRGSMPGGTRTRRSPRRVPSRPR